MGRRGWRSRPGAAAPGFLALFLASPPIAAQSPIAPPHPAPQVEPAGEAESGSKDRPERRPNRAVPPTIEVLAAKVARYPSQPYLLNELGNLLLLNGRRQDAETRYRQALAIDPGYAAAWNNLGVVRASLGKMTAASEAYRKAVKIQPNYALAWYNLGASLDARNHYDAAIDAYRRAFVLDPGLLDVKRNPQVVSNRRIEAIAAQAYIERGNTVVFPIDSAYPMSSAINIRLSAETPPAPRRPQ
jgi:tetratricopeptide (TPR) repeat protein